MSYSKIERKIMKDFFLNDNSNDPSSMIITSNKNSITLMSNKNRIDFINYIHDNDTFEVIVNKSGNKNKYQYLDYSEVKNLYFFLNNYLKNNKKINMKDWYSREFIDEYKISIGRKKKDESIKKSIFIKLKQKYQEKIEISKKKKKLKYQERMTKFTMWFIIFILYFSVISMFFDINDRQTKLDKSMNNKEKILVIDEYGNLSKMVDKNVI